MINPTSQAGLLLEAFKKGEMLTANEALIKHGIGTFSQRICDIERAGYVVYRSWVTGATGAKFMKYWITQDQFKKVA